MKALALLLFSLLLITGSSAQEAATDSLYYGQTPPGNEAVLFADEVISQTGRFDHDICFSPDGKEMLFSVSEANWTDFTLYHSYWIGEEWSEIAIAELSASHRNTEAIFAPNGKSVFFASSRAPGATPYEFAVFKAYKNGNSWFEPTETGIKAQQPGDNYGNWHPSVTTDSTLYFSSYKDGNYDIYYSEFVDGSYTGFNNIGSPINGSSNDWYPWIAPDGNTLLFSSTRSGGYGASDLYVAFKDETGQWSDPINLGSKINTAHDESSPRITYDGKYFFFTRTQNWDGNFYWIKADFIDNLRPSSPVNAINHIENDTDDIAVYPNPSAGEVNITNNTSCSALCYQLINLTGTIVDQGIIESSVRLNLSNQSSGIYMMCFNINDQYLKTILFLN